MTIQENNIKNLKIIFLFNAAECGLGYFSKQYV